MVYVYSSFPRVNKSMRSLWDAGERTREGNDLYHEMMASGVPRRYIEP